MAMNRVIVFAFAIVVESVFCAPELSNSNACSRSDPNFNVCLKQRLQTAINDLKNGDNELKTTPFDPLIVNTINLGDNYIKIRIRGLSETKIDDFLMDVDTCKMYAETSTPAITTDAEFRTNGKLSVMPVDDENAEDAVINDVKVVHIIQCEKYRKDMVEHLRLTDYKFIMNPKRAVKKFNGLLKDNEGTAKHKLGKSEVKSSKEDTLKTEYEKIFMKVINDILARIPVKQLYTS